MAQAVPLGWAGSFAALSGPLASGESEFWVARGPVGGRENRFYLFSPSCTGEVAAELEVRNVSHFRGPLGVVGLGEIQETHFEIHNNGSDEPVYYYFYMAWSDPINI